MFKIGFFIATLLFAVSLYAKENKSFPTYRFGGQLALDLGYIDSKSDTEIRRARLFFKGAYSKNLAYELEYSLRHGGKWKDLYLKYSGLPYITLKVGNIKEPFGLEALTSSKYNTFMERSLADIFISDRRLGATLKINSYQKKSHAWSFTIGGFGESINDVDDFGDSYSIASRVTYAYFLDKKAFLHLGLSSAYTDIDDKKIKFSTRAESHIVDNKLVKLKIKHIDTISRFGFESVFQFDRFSLQGEYILDNIETTNLQSYNFYSWYIQSSYFLTQDRRSYKAKDGVYKRVKPKDKKLGALELATRVSYLDMSDNSKNGGEVYNYTIGMNYYINNHARAMLNYIITDIQSGTLSYDPNIVQFRVQYDF